MIYPAGSHLELDHGTYEHCSHGTFLVIKDIDQALVLKKFRDSLPNLHKNSFLPYEFCEWLIAQGFLQRLDNLKAWHMGDGMSWPKPN